MMWWCCRFAYRSNINQLPKWLRPYVQTYDKFGLVQRDLTQFFRNAEKQVCGVKSIFSTSQCVCVFHTVWWQGT